jgi:hypothetical protein
MEEERLKLMRGIECWLGGRLGATPSGSKGIAIQMGTGERVSFGMWGGELLLRAEPLLRPWGGSVRCLLGARAQRTEEQWGMRVER